MFDCNIVCKEQMSLYYTLKCEMWNMWINSSCCNPSPCTWVSKGAWGGESPVTYLLYLSMWHSVQFQQIMCKNIQAFFIPVCEHFHTGKVYCMVGDISNKSLATSAFYDAFRECDRETEYVLSSCSEKFVSSGRSASGHVFFIWWITYFEFTQFHRM